MDPKNLANDIVLRRKMDEDGWVKVHHLSSRNLVYKIAQVTCMVYV